MNRSLPLLRTCCLGLASIAGIIGLSGCGSTNSRTATEQLLSSDAVDSAIARIDFRPLASQRVYFDTTYLTNYKGVGFVNAEYIISSLRQQMVGAGCLLQDTKDEADYVVEGRVGALGTDSHDIVYGIPASNGISSAASIVSGVPTIPAIPEISFACKNNQKSAAKVALFAYEKDSRQRVWQSGMSLATSSAKDTWLLGAGPFQSGSVYDGVKFAGSNLETFALPLSGDVEDEAERAIMSDLREPIVFKRPRKPKPEVPKELVADEDAPEDGVVPASAEVEGTGVEGSVEVDPPEAGHSHGGG